MLLLLLDSLLLLLLLSCEVSCRLVRALNLGGSCCCAGASRWLGHECHSLGAGCLPKQLHLLLRRRVARAAASAAEVAQVGWQCTIQQRLLGEAVPA